MSHVFTCITKNFAYALKNADRSKPSAVFHINRSQEKYYLATSVLGDSYGLPAETHAKWGKCLERDFQISKYHLLSQGENGNMG